MALVIGVGIEHVRDHIPLKQGLRHLLDCQKISELEVRDHIPLKQGLRHQSGQVKVVRGFGTRPYSIKTRIKTKPSEIRVFVFI